MLKEFSWETFKRTGDIEAYLLFKEIKSCENTEEKDGEMTKNTNHARETLEV